MKSLYILLLSAVVLLPGLAYAVSIRTTDNRVYNNVRLVKVTAKGLVFKYRHRRSEFVTLKPEELDYGTRQDYVKQIKIYNSIQKSRKERQEQIADKRQHYFNMQVERLNDADPVKHLQLLIRLRRSFVAESFKGLKHDFSIWRKKVNTVFPEYENALLKMPSVDAVDCFKRDREECREIGVLEGDFSSLWEKMTESFVQKFPGELEKLKNLPLESRTPHAEKMLVIYKDCSVDLGKIRSVIEADKMEFSILKALKDVEAGSDHAAEIAVLENLINSYPQHPKIPELKKLKEQHEYNLQVKNDLAALASLYSRYSKNPVEVIRKMEKAVKAYSDSLYSGELTTQLADFNEKWKIEKKRQEEEARRRAEAEAERRAEEERVRKRRQAEEQAHIERLEYRQRYGVWPCWFCKGKGLLYIPTPLGTTRLICPKCYGRGQRNSYSK